MKQSDQMIEMVDEIPPLIPEGEYLITYKYHETATVFTTSKVFAYFDIVEQGPHLGIRLYRPFRVRELIGKPRKNGRFKLGKRHELFLELCRLDERGIRLRPDRLSLHVLKNTVIRATIRTVTTDYKQRPLPKRLRYSVIGEFKGVEVGTVL